MKTEIVPLGRLHELAKRFDANLLLVKPVKTSCPFSADYKVIKFSTRKALEEFNKKAGLRPIVFTHVKKHHNIYAHEIGDL